MPSASVPRKAAGAAPRSGLRDGETGLVLIDVGISMASGQSQFQSNHLDHVKLNGKQQGAWFFLADLLTFGVTGSVGSTCSMFLFILLVTAGSGGSMRRCSGSFSS